MTLTLDGKKVRDEIKERLAHHVSLLSLEQIPTLSIIQIGSNPASTTYIKSKIAFGKAIGIKVVLTQFGETVTEEEVVAFIQKQNTNTEVGGIIVQLPLSAHLNKSSIIESIHPTKDVDGLHSVNFKKLCENDSSGIIPATTRGIFSLLTFYNIPLEGKRVLVIGRSTLVGKPTALQCLNQNATVTIAHSKTQNLVELCKDADIIISATGIKNLISKDHVKSEHIIIDVGINGSAEEMCGDVSYAEVFPLVAALSPVPGGVGPLTVASLFENLLKL